MKYESSILKRLIDTYGVIGNPRYLSEIIKEFIVRGKELYPQLFTYQSDWLAHIDEFGLTPEYTVSYTGQHIYAPNTKEKPVKSAILTGNTETIIDKFEQGTINTWNGTSFPKPDSTTRIRLKNIIELKQDIIIGVNDKYELSVQTSDKNAYGWSSQISFTNNGTFIIAVRKKDGSEIVPSDILGADFNINIPHFTDMQSVKMPVLKTVGKNLFDKTVFTRVDNKWIDENGSEMSQTTLGYSKNLYYIGMGTFTISGTIGNDIRLFFYDKQGVFKGRTPLFTNTLTFSCDEETYIRIGYRLTTLNVDNIQVEKGTQATTYEPYKSNILTVNEDVTLRSNGDVCDELDLLTGKLTQRIDEDGEVLVQEVVKTVDLTIHDKDHQKVERLTSFEGGTHFTTSSQDGSLLPTLTVNVVTDLEETLMVCSLEGNTM